MMIVSEDTITDRPFRAGQPAAGLSGSEADGMGAIRAETDGIPQCVHDINMFMFHYTYIPTDSIYSM